MFPSTSRVKLNRAALKDVVELKLVPRRRRVHVTADSQRQHENHKVTQSHKDNKSVHTFLPRQMGPENVTDNAGYIPGGEPEETRVVGTQKGDIMSRHVKRVIVRSSNRRGRTLGAGINRANQTPGAGEAGLHQKAQIGLYLVPVRRLRRALFKQTEVAKCPVKLS